MSTETKTSITAVNTDREGRQVAEYKALRHLFSDAVESSLTDRRWVIFGTFSDPGRTMLTEYQHSASGDRIKCQSFDYADGEYRKHMYTFTQEAEI